MDEHKKTDIEYEIADIVIGMPQDFFAGDKEFRLYPVTLAKMFLLKRHIENLGFNNEIAKANPYVEALRLVQEHRDICCHILAIHTTPNTYKDLFDNKSIEERKNDFISCCSDEDLTMMMVYALTWDKTGEIVEYIGLNKESERRRAIMQVKDKQKNNVSFGGLSIFGAFIGQLKEMGYTDNEILYEKSYCYLRLMLADKIFSIYLSDEELKMLPESSGGTMIYADDPQAMEKLMGRLKGVKFE